MEDRRWSRCGSRDRRSCDRGSSSHRARRRCPARSPRVHSNALPAMSSGRTGSSRPGASRPRRAPSDRAVGRVDVGVVGLDHVTDGVRATVGAARRALPLDLAAQPRAQHPSGAVEPRGVRARPRPPRCRAPGSGASPGSTSRDRDRRSGSARPTPPCTMRRSAAASAASLRCRARDLDRRDRLLIGTYGEQLRALGLGLRVDVRRASPERHLVARDQERRRCGAGAAARSTKNVAPGLVVGALPYRNEPRRDVDVARGDGGRRRRRELELERRAALDDDRLAHRSATRRRDLDDVQARRAARRCTGSAPAGALPSSGIVAPAGAWTTTRPGASTARARLPSASYDRRAARPARRAARHRARARRARRARAGCRRAGRGRPRASDPWRTRPRHAAPPRDTARRRPPRWSSTLLHSASPSPRRRRRTPRTPALASARCSRSARRASSSVDRAPPRARRRPHPASRCAPTVALDRRDRHRPARPRRRRRAAPQPASAAGSRATDAATNARSTVRQVRWIERERLVEPRPAPRRVAAPAEALPLGARLGEPLAARAILGVGVEPVAQRAPAADQALRARARRSAPASPSWTTSSRPLTSAATRGARAVADRQLGLGAPHAGADRGHQAQQDAARVRAIGRRHPARSPRRRGARARRRRRPSRRASPA